MTTSDSTSAYKPGECNINQTEITFRRRTGYLGAAFFLAGLALTLLFTTIVWWRLLLVLPAYLAAIGWLQAYHKFCVAYGITGRQNAEPGSTRPNTVTNELALQKDRRRAQQLQLEAVAVAGAATLLTLLISVK